MEPSIGRTVIYKTTKEERDLMKLNGNPQEELPATIVAVHGSGLVNLKVHTDSPHSALWKTSPEEGDQEGQWHWPVIK
tara:strand:- start:52 stop:285 length:234 start_codon:yes stop_codon:yes gene_type:complete